MLYKYMPCERVDVLEKLKIRFSPLPSLNDPFESKPLIDITVERNELVSDMETNIEELWSNTSSHVKTEANRRMLERKKNELINHRGRCLLSTLILTLA